MTARALLAIMAFSFTVHVGADEKKEEKVDTKLLVGKWKEPDGNKAEIEFMKDGKAKMTDIVLGSRTTIEVTYKVEGNKLTLTSKTGQFRINTINKLNGMKLEITPGAGHLRTYGRLVDA